jgi:hypothetical protein
MEDCKEMPESGSPDNPEPEKIGDPRKIEPSEKEVDEPRRPDKKEP